MKLKRGFFGLFGGGFFSYSFGIKWLPNSFRQSTLMWQKMECRKVIYVIWLLLPSVYKPIFQNSDFQHSGI